MPTHNVHSGCPVAGFAAKVLVIIVAIAHGSITAPVVAFGRFHLTLSTLSEDEITGRNDKMDAISHALLKIADPDPPIRG